jgi:DNA primase
MLIVDGKPIIESIETIIGVLRYQLKEQGIELFQSIKRSGNNLMIHCPFHKGGQERRPSCGVKLEGDDKVPAGYVHCFTCGYSAPFTQMISNVFGVKDYGQFGEKWLLKNFISLEITNRPNLDLNLSRQFKNTKIKYVDEKELDSYRYYHPYMFARKLTKEVIERYDVGYDKKTDCLTFPVRDESGGTLFIARRSVKSKFFNYPKEVEKPLYGIYELKKYLDDGNRKTNSYGGIIRNIKNIYVTESIINALTVNVYGKWAVATNGCQFSELQVKQLEKLPAREIIIAYDGDEAGRVAAYKLKFRLNKRKLVSILQLPDGRDINDISEEYFKVLKRIR